MHRVVILSKFSYKKYQAELSRIFHQLPAGMMESLHLLLLYEDGIAKFRPCFQNCVRLLLKTNSIEVAEVIERFMATVEMESGELQI